MQKLSNCELYKVVGGFEISGAFITAFVRGINTFLDLGRNLGSAIRRLFCKSMCPL